MSFYFISNSRYFMIPTYTIQYNFLFLSFSYFGVFRRHSEVSARLSEALRKHCEVRGKRSELSLSHHNVSRKRLKVYHGLVRMSAKLF